MNTPAHRTRLSIGALIAAGTLALAQAGLAQDKAWLDDCNAVLDSDFAQSQRRSVGIVPELHLDPECSQLIAPAPGTEQPEERVSNTWALPLPYGAPFRRMIDCEPISRR